MQPTTLAEAIEMAAAKATGRGFRFVQNDKWAETFLTFEQIESETAALGGALQALGLSQGDRLALILPDTRAFVLTFLAALRAGVVPVPIYPPANLDRLSSYLEHTRQIVDRSGARALVTTTAIKQLLGSVQDRCPALRHVLPFKALSDGDQPLRAVRIAPDDTAFLQFTSGSTSTPKGVVLTHANLLANIRNIFVEGLEIDPEVDSAMTWLPLFHDMGLIGFVLTPLVGTIQTTFMSPMTFLFRPAAWLQAMSRYQATMTFGPNFAYALCVKRIRPRELEGVDLSRWRVAGCGAEPIRAETLESFAHTFGPLGFRKQAFYPSYGLAESTLAVAFSRGLSTARVRASALWEQGRAVPTEQDAEDSLRLVSCGRAFERHEIGVFALDDELGEARLPEGVVGELRLRGPSVSSGYFDEPELTRKAFAGGWFRTGDLGYLLDGNTYICGRSKELVIVNGRNFYPHDLEWEASQVPGVRKGNVAAFGVASPGGDSESVAIVLETAATDAAERSRITSDVRSRILESTGLTLDPILLLSPGTLPKTSSGKLQRTKVRQLYEQGQLLELQSAREADRIAQVKEVAKSQMAYLKLAVLGRFLDRSS